MSEDQPSSGGLGKSLVLILLALFVLYYGIQVMRGGSQSTPAHSPTDMASTEHPEGAVESEADSAPTVPVVHEEAKARVSQKAIDELKMKLNEAQAELAEVKSELQDNRLQLKDSEHKLGLVRNLLKAEETVSSK